MEVKGLSPQIRPGGLASDIAWIGDEDKQCKRAREENRRLIWEENWF